MNSNYSIEQVRQSIEASKVFVEKGEALNRLKKNADFKRLISNGYLEQEAIRLVHLKAESLFQTPERQAELDRQITAIGYLNQYFVMVNSMAGTAAKSIKSDEVTLEELAEEGIV